MSNKYEKQVEYEKDFMKELPFKNKKLLTKS